MIATRRWTNLISMFDEIITTDDLLLLGIHLGKFCLLRLWCWYVLMDDHQVSSEGEGKEVKSAKQRVGGRQLETWGRRGPGAGRAAGSSRQLLGPWQSRQDTQKSWRLKAPALAPMVANC